MWGSKFQKIEKNVGLKVLTQWASKDGTTGVSWTSLILAMGSLYFSVNVIIIFKGCLLLLLPFHVVI